MNKGTKKCLIKGDILHFLSNPNLESTGKSYQYFEKGLLLIENGLVSSVGTEQDIKKKFSEDVEIVDHSGKLILPGFIDTHLHYAQTDIIASHGKQLLEWLETYTFPKEGQFIDPIYTGQVSDFFLDELLRNGTTTAQVFCTVHPHSADIFFRKSKNRNMRMIAGKVMMDQNAPDYLTDTPQRSYDESLQLIYQWHQKDRLLYAVTPRFAVTSSEAQLEKAGALMAAAPNLYMHTHLSENANEIKYVSELFPWSKNYLDVYDHFGLVTDRSTFAHSIHLSDLEYQRMAETGAAISFCPTSNLFIGSGLFDLKKVSSQRIAVGIGTDVGGGTSFSMFQTLAEAYKVLQLNGQNLSALHAFYLITLGGAASLKLDSVIGNFETGKEADFTVINYNATPLMERRQKYAETLEEKLFALIILGDDRSIDATYIMGEQAYHCGT
jgi:guanine deaminase